MSATIEQLKPEKVFHFFAEVCKIPHPSKKEAKMAAYLMDFARERKLESIIDEIGNVLIRKPAFAGYENLVPVVLQSHIDMVCEKNSDRKSTRLNSSHANISYAVFC